MEIFLYLCFIIITLISAFILRVIYLICLIFSTECKLSKESSLRTILCIGSGGHTTELLRLSKHLDKSKYSPRLYILADNDKSSEIKVHNEENGQNNYCLSKIPRSRNVKQSYHSSVFTILYSTLCTIPIVYNFKPDVILCNGPGTCFPICVVAFIMRCLFILDCRIIFVESICRVRTISLTGKVLQYFADIIVVQWPQLRDVCLRAKYFGRLT